MTKSGLIQGQNIYRKIDIYCYTFSLLLFVSVSIILETDIKIIIFLIKPLKFEMCIFICLLFTYGLIYLKLEIYIVLKLLTNYSYRKINRV